MNTHPTFMGWTFEIRLTLTVVAAALALATGAHLGAETLPNPYSVVMDFFTLPGRTMGSAAGIDIDRDGKSIWVVERCGGASQALACADSNVAPLLEFDASGRLVKSLSR